MLKNSKRCSQVCDSNNGVLSKLVLSDTAWSLDVICAGNDEKKSLGEMKDEEQQKVFFERKVWSQKGGKFSLGCPTLLTVFDSLLPFFLFLFKRKKRAKSP
jgi:hypothetical protein